MIAASTSTLTISPTTALDERPGLRADLALISAEPLPISAASTELTVTVRSDRTLQAVGITTSYSDVLTLINPIEAQIDIEAVRSYETVIVKLDIPMELALAVRENGTYLPGVTVVEGYRRNYPQSAALQSLSHLLGYTGRISECELVTENPASSWMTSMVDIVGHAATCKRLIRKRIEPSSIGLPPYQIEDRIGKDGLEASYEAVLRGEAGVAKLLVDALERPVSSATTIREVQDGQNLVLTIDLAFQQQTEAILRRWVAEGENRRVNAKEEHKRTYEPITNGVAVVLDPRSGEILALVSLPAYDNNVWADPNRGVELQNLLAPADPAALQELLRLAPLTNRAIAGQYPPGSTLKQFVGAIALQEGIIAPETKLRDPGLIRLIERSGAPFELPNSVRSRDNGEIDVREALRISSNVFFAAVAGGNDQATNLAEEDLRVAGLQIDRLGDGLAWFGFGQPTTIDLAGEAAGLLPSSAWKAQVKRETWTTGDTFNMSIGQGDMQVTPLQLASAAGAMAIDGTVYIPHLVREITDSDGRTLQTIAPRVHTQAPVNPAYLQAVREGMRLSVTDGLNVAARDECAGLSIAGKTGTAEFGPIIETLDKRQVRQSHSWFVGFAPYDNPQIVVAVLLEGTGDLGDGSSTLAVPAVTQIMQAYFKVAPPAERPATCPKLPGEEVPQTVATTP
ncbi:peptidoglycan glycosyltransferase [Candidatus Gracilibacteria bacterium]|nr:peptidoglycan glycosyltransferase [Candidatus Gracilibacteria bacterium]